MDDFWINFKKEYFGKFYNCDVLELFEQMPEGCVDLVVSDPPYLIDYQSNRRKATPKFDKMQGDNDPNLISIYFEECYRIMKDNTSIYIFCTWKNIEFFKVEFEKHFKLKNILVWDKGVWGSGDLKGAYGPQHEFILYGHKGRDYLRRKRYSDILRFKKVPAAKLLHPAQKPVELLMFLILNSSDKNALVFDGFAGIGSVGFACRLTHRRYLLSEIEEEYWQHGRIFHSDNLLVGEDYDEQ